MKITFNDVKWRKDYDSDTFKIGVIKTIELDVDEHVITIVGALVFLILVIVTNVLYGVEPVPGALLEKAAFTEVNKPVGKLKVSLVYQRLPL